MVRKVTYEVDRKKREKQDEESFWETRYPLDSGEKIYLFTSFSKQEKRTRDERTIFIAKKTVYVFSNPHLTPQNGERSSNVSIVRTKITNAK